MFLANLANVKRFVNSKAESQSEDIDVRESDRLPVRRSQKRKLKWGEWGRDVQASRKLSAFATNRDARSLAIYRI